MENFTRLFESFSRLCGRNALAKLVFPHGLAGYGPISAYKTRLLEQTEQCGIRNIWHQFPQDKLDFERGRLDDALPFRRGE
jgi:hypothetical protein